MTAFLTRTLVAASLAWSTSAAFAIDNGSFETPTAPVGSFTTFNAGSSGLTGWTIVSGSVDQIGAGFWASRPPAAGSQMLDLNGNEAGWIQQSFAGIAGQIYQVTFKYWSNPDSQSGIPGSDTGQRTAESFITDNGFLKPQLARLDFGASPLATGWETASYSFTAGSTGTYYLNFKGFEYGPYGVLLDDVQLAAVPEPGTYALMLAGLGALGFMARRRRSGSAMNGIAGATPA